MNFLCSDPCLPQGIEELAKGEWAKLRCLNLSYNSLGAASGFSIGRLLDKTRELQELVLEHCGLSSLTLQPNSGLLESVKSEWVFLAKFLHSF